MEFSISSDKATIMGEILIPLENTLTSLAEANNDLTDLESILKLNIYSFRSIIFQNELLRFFLVIKFPDSKSLSTYSDILYIKSKFISNTDHPRELIDDEDIRDYNTSLNSHGNITTELKKENLNEDSCDTISRRHIIPNKDILILEIQKHILIPNSYVNNNMSFKVDIMKLNVMHKPKTFNLNDFSFSNINEKRNKKFSVLLSFSKQVKVIRPLYVSQTKQLDCSPECSILQIKIENITSTVNFIDNSIKDSAFIIYSNEFDNNVELVNFGIDFKINDIKVLKNETIIDNKMTVNIDKGEQYHQREQLPIAINSIAFEVLNHNFPITIKPGEEYNISLKLLKGKDIFNPSYEGDMHYTENYGNNSSLATPQNDSNKESIRPSLFNQSGGIKNKRESFFAKLTKKIPFGKNDKVNQAMLNANNISDVSIGIINKDQLKFIGVSNDNQIIKLGMSTPIILSLSPNDNYEDMYMKINLKWKSELENIMTIHFNIEEDENCGNIYIDRYFNVKLTFTNMSNKQGDYSIDFCDSFSEIKLNDEHYNEFKTKCKDGLPDIINENKILTIGQISPKESKSINIRFLPTKTGYIALPSFNVKDNINGKTFFVAHTNKIYVNDE